MLIASIVLLQPFGTASAADDSQELSMVVMDPLSAELACKCVGGYAQRDYHALARFLGKKLDRSVKVYFAENLKKGIARTPNGQADIVVGKKSIVDFDATQYKQNLKPIAGLTGPKGTTTFTGMFVVPKDDPAKSISDLKGYRIFFGPKSCQS